jgi:hypothetical protein
MSRPALTGRKMTAEEADPARGAAHRARTAGLGVESVEEDEPLLPKFDYHLDESDPDILVLRRQDGSFVAAFSARGATKEGIAEAANEDYWKVIEANAESLGLREDGDRARSA